MTLGANEAFSAMSIFNFIIDEDLRSSLEVDYEELLRCVAGKAWKASHVLAGSLIEALLIDSLVSDGAVPRNDALQLDLGQAIQKAKQTGMISAKSADLCSAIRAYRNLIHPGRSVRLGEQVDADTAAVAASLVKIIVGEVARKRLENYGYTAEQLLAKIERDSSIDAIFGHLLKDMKPIEVDRLLTSVIPARHLAATEEFDVPGHLLRTLTSCFRTAFDQSPHELKETVARRFVDVLKQGSDHAVLSYCDAFFRASDLQYLTGNDVDLVRDYLLARCKPGPHVRRPVCRLGRNRRVP